MVLVGSIQAFMEVDFLKAYLVGARMEFTHSATRGMSIYMKIKGGIPLLGFLLEAYPLIGLLGQT